MALMKGFTMSLSCVVLPDVREIVDSIRSAHGDEGGRNVKSRYRDAYAVSRGLCRTSDDCPWITDGTWCLLRSALIRPMPDLPSFDSRGLSMPTDLIREAWEDGVTAGEDPKHSEPAWIGAARATDRHVGLTDRTLPLASACYPLGDCGYGLDAWRVALVVRYTGARRARWVCRGASGRAKIGPAVFFTRSDEPVALLMPMKAPAGSPAPADSVTA